MSSHSIMVCKFSKLLSSLWVSCTGSASDWCALQEALYKCIRYNKIQYNRKDKFEMGLGLSTRSFSVKACSHSSQPHPEQSLEGHHRRACWVEMSGCRL